MKAFSVIGYNKTCAIQKMENLNKTKIVIGMATDENGIPLHYKNISRKCYWFNTFIPFMLEIADIYEVNSVTIIANKGMSVNRNIRLIRI